MRPPAASSPASGLTGTLVSSSHTIGTGGRNSYGGVGFSLDGIQTKSGTLQRGLAETASLDAIGEFKTLTTGAPAEFNQPAQIVVVTQSGANAIHGVVVIGAIIIMGKAESDNYLALILGFLAVILGTLNVVGGFVVTNRMLEMFKSKNQKTKA